MSTHDAPLETIRCDRCQCLLGQEERANYRDTGFPECNECYARRVAAGAMFDARARMFGDERGLPPAPLRLQTGYPET